jgi:hypothetical protein
MTLWLTLLLVWTAGIPVAVFLTATVGARLGERRQARVGHLGPVAGSLCSRRLHSYRMGFAAERRRYAGRRPA